MNRSNPQDGETTGDRRKRAHAIVAEIIALRRSGEEISDEDVIAQYQDLMPELADELKIAGRIREAVDQVCKETISRPHQRIDGICGPCPPGEPASPDNAVAPQYANGDRIGRYQVRKCIGQGHFGAVYHASDDDLKRDVAIKVPREGRFDSDESVEQFIREAQTVAALDHEAIVRVYDVGRQADGMPFVVMEFVDGQTLRELIRSQELSPVEACNLMARIAEAVAYAHRKRFIHRDLKPGNILIDQEQNPHVADFGLALHERQQRDRRGESAGTPRYMAPEQVRGETHLMDGRVDIWALGVIFYEMLVGGPPFDGDTIDGISDEILNRDPRPPRQIDSSLPDALERICLKCLAKNANDRYSTAADLARDLRKFSASKPRAALFVGLGLAAVVLVVVLVFAQGFFGPDRQPTPFNGGESPDGKNDVIEPLTGTVDVLVWDPENLSRRGLALYQPGALPMKRGDQIRVAAQLSRPAYLYLVWVDSEGVASPVYPWQPGHWDDRPEKQSPVQSIRLPETLDEGWPMEGPAGMETVLLLARSTALPDEVDIKDLLAGLPEQPVANDRSLVWFHDGEMVTEAQDRLRAPNFAEVQQIDDAVLRTQRMIAERLGPHFEIIRAASFAKVGE